MRRRSVYVAVALSPSLAALRVRVDASTGRVDYC